MSGSVGVPLLFANNCITLFAVPGSGVYLMCSSSFSLSPCSSFCWNTPGVKLSSSMAISNTIDDFCCCSLLRVSAGHMSVLDISSVCLINSIFLLLAVSSDFLLSRAVLIFF